MKRIPPLPVLFGAWLASWLFAVSAMAAASDPTNGQKIAERWCTGCHVVNGGRVGGTDATPPLAKIARNPLATPTRLASFLALPHGGMAGMSFSQQEIRDLVSYMQRLKTTP